MTTLVIGGSGFVGLNLVEAGLRRSDRIIAFDKISLPSEAERAFSNLPGELSSVQGDITNLDKGATISLQLDKDLSEYDGPWICGNVYTMADCLWAISLYRIQWLGHASLWANFQKISEYAAHLYSRPALQKAFINWPGPMPSSPHTIGINTHVANDYKEII